MHSVRLSDPIIIGHKSWQEEVQKRNFSEDKAVEFIGEIGDNLSKLQPGIDFWRDVLPSLQKPLENINKDSNTKAKVQAFLRNVINTQGNKDSVQLDIDYGDDSENDLFNAINTHHKESTPEEIDTAGVKSYSYQLDSKKVSITPIYADNELHANTAFEIQKDKELYEEISERRKEKFINLIDSLGLAAEKSHFLLLLNGKLRGADISKMRTPQSGIGAEDKLIKVGDAFPLGERVPIEQSPETYRAQIEQKNRLLKLDYHVFDLKEPQTGEKLDEAISAFRTELVSGSFEPGTLRLAQLQYQLGILLYEKTGNDAEAARLLQNAVLSKVFQKEPQIVNGVKKLALLQMRQGKHENALDTLQELKNANIEGFHLAQVHAFTGECLINLGRHEEAIEPLQKAVDLKNNLTQRPVLLDANPKFWTTTALNLSILQLEQKEYGGGVATSQKIVEAHTLMGAELADVNNNLAVCLGHIGENERAIGPSKEAISGYHLAKRPMERKKAVRNLVALLLRMEKYDDAAAALQELVDTDDGPLTPTELAEAEVDIKYILTKSKNSPPQKVQPIMGLQSEPQPSGSVAAQAPNTTTESISLHDLLLLQETTPADVIATQAPQLGSSTSGIVGDDIYTASSPPSIHHEERSHTHNSSELQSRQQGQSDAPPAEAAQQAGGSKSCAKIVKDAALKYSKKTAVKAKELYRRYR